MFRAIAPPTAKFLQLSNTWLARRWYYTPRSHRAYSVRQISPGDRRLLAEFAIALSNAATDRELSGLHGLTRILFDRVIAADGHDDAVGFAALENTSAGDRIIGVAAYAPSSRDCADFVTAVISSFREEQVGRTLLAALLRHAKRVGLPRLNGEMVWSNRPMQMLAMSMGFTVEPVARDRNLRSLSLILKSRE